MTTQQIILFTCGYLVVLVAVIYFTRANARRVIGAMAGGAAAGLLGVGAIALCEALEARKLVIPTDNFKPVDMVQLCTPDAETPRGAPLHPGAERFYRERGYLKT